MTLKIDLSRKPYFDDFDTEKNYQKVLFRPAVSVQTRELNQLQTILQDQIDKFGRSIYKDGSIIEGCSFTFDNNYNFIKILDDYSNGTAISSIEDFKGLIIKNTANLQAVIIDTVSGFESQDPNFNTLYVKYLNSGTYSNGSVQSQYSNSDILQLYTSADISIGNVVAANTSNVSGRGYAMTTTDGVVFKSGFFIRVPSQTLIVSKYDNVPNNISVGFDLEESIITPETDSTLVDNAAGSPNEDAPGAHRLKLVPVLATRLSSDIANSATFFSLVDFKNGLPITVRNDPQYSALGKELARRTYETSGDYVITPFILTTENKSSTDINKTNYLNLVSSPGLGYIKGNRIEFLNKNTANLRKGLDTTSVPSQQVTANFGFYVYVDEYCGDFNNEQIGQVELHSLPRLALTNKSFLNTSYNSSTKIGTAYIRGISYDDSIPGTPTGQYRLYLFNIVMNAGFNFADVQSIIRYDSGVKAVADVILKYNASTEKYEAFLEDSTAEIMIHPFGQKAIKPSGFANVQYVYRNSSNQQFDMSGSMTIGLTTVGTGQDSFYYQGTLSTNNKDSFIVIPTANRRSQASLTGTVSTTANDRTVTGSSTTFTSSYSVGDYIQISSQTRRITIILNDTSLIVDDPILTTGSGLSHYKEFPTGVPINFKQAGRTIVTSGTSATLNLNHSINAAMQCTVYHDVKRSETVPIGKKLNTDTHIAIYTGNNASGASGPWCLGIPDVFRLKHVYVGTTKANTNSDMVSDFILDNGQRDSYYGLSYISTKKPIGNDKWLLAVVDNFTQDTTQGKGFFTANSYPIDDANTANTQAITTSEIPIYTSIFTGKSYDLRDCVDFRPYSTNTAVANATSNTSATVNPSTAAASVYVVDGAGSFLPSPDLPYQSTIEYYLPRKDRVSLTTGGNILISEGVPSEKPIAPLEVPDTMTIGILDIPPYPTLTAEDASASGRYDYAVQSTIQQIKRYTMSDIGKLANRIDRLEYYTSLSLVEQNASALLVKSDITGLNRFKNGILVDPFKDHTIGNTNNPLYRIAIDTDRGEARPLFSQGFTKMYYDDNLSTNTTRTGDIVTLDYVSVINQQQNYASKYINPAPGNQFHFVGSMQLYPPGIINIDITKAPDVIGDIDLSSNWTNMRNYISTAYSSVWNNWTTQVLTADQRSKLEISPYNNQVVTTSIQQSQLTGKDIQVQNTQNLVTNGNYITNVSILPYIQSSPIFFIANGLKPLTILYVYFNNKPVTQYCYPLTKYTGTVITSGGIKKTDTGKNVYTDQNGENYSYNSLYGATYPSIGSIQADVNGQVYGIFWIPDSTFRSGEIELLLTDVSNITNIQNSTTEARTKFFATNLYIQTDKTNQIRNPSINISEENNINNLNQNPNIPISNDPVSATPPPTYIESSQYNGNDGGWVTIISRSDIIDTSIQYTGQGSGYVEVPIYSSYSGKQDEIGNGGNN